MHFPPLEQRPLKGLTLVELLVAITVVATLAAAVMGAVTSVKNTSAATKCATNLRQIQQMATVWTLDNDGWLPQAMWYLDGISKKRSGATNLRKVGLTDAFIKCPSSQLLPPNYGISGRLVLSTNPQWGTNDTYYWDHGQYKSSNLAARTIAFAETASLTSGGQTGAYISGVSLVAYPHTDHANVAFVDGHVEALKSTDLEIAMPWTRGLPGY